jgi:DNA-binding transcriptional MerR regulator
VLVRLEVITTAQQAGFSLEDIRGFLLEGLSGWKHGALLPALRRKVGDIKEMQKRLSRTRAQIDALIANIEERPHGMTCEENTDWLLAPIRQTDRAQVQAGHFTEPPEMITGK